VQEGIPQGSADAILRVFSRKRRAPSVDAARARVRRFAGLAARFARPSMLNWLKRYPQLLDHNMATLQHRIEVGIPALDQGRCIGEGAGAGYGRGWLAG
jgi:hypothetical protein